MLFSFPQVQYPEGKTHIVVRGAWDDYRIWMCKRECKEITWSGEKNDPAQSMHKQWCNQWPDFWLSTASILRFASDPPFLRWLESVTGERSLLPDPYLHGGGVHRVSRGGYLKMHCDFNFHEGMQLYRRINLLLYLNEGWRDEWGGHLQIAGQRIAPEANTMVIFTTDDASWHGHPDPLQCPEDVHRDAIALYYYSARKPMRNFERVRLSTDYNYR